MLTSPITVTIGSDSLSFRRVNQDNYTGSYYAVSSDGLRRYTLQVKHTIPSKGKSGESHLIRIDREVFNTDGVYVKTESVWTVLASTGAPQDAATMAELEEGLIAMITANTNAIIDGVLLRES